MIGSENVGGHGTQARDDARIASNAAGVPGEGDIADVVAPVFDMPGVPNGRGEDAPGPKFRGQLKAGRMGDIADWRNLFGAIFSRQSVVIPTRQCLIMNIESP